MPATQDSFEEQAKTIVYDLVDKLSGLANTARKNDLGLLIEPNAFNNHLAAITAAHHHAVTEAVREALERVKNRVLRTSTFHPLYASQNQEHAVDDARNTVMGLIDAELAKLSPTTEGK